MMGCCGKVAGIVKLARSEWNIGVVSLPQLIADRRKACEACDRWEHGRCLECKCFTWAKTRLPKEKCPLGRWPEDATEATNADKG